MQLTQIGDTSVCDENRLSLPKQEFVNKMTVYYNRQSIIAIYFYTTEDQDFAKGKTTGATATQDIKFTEQEPLIGLWGS